MSACMELKAKPGAKNGSGILVANARSLYLDM